MNRCEDQIPANEKAPKVKEVSHPMKVDLSSFWDLPEDVLVSALRSSPSGLSELESQARQTQMVLDPIQRRRRTSLAILATQISNPIVLLLTVSAVLSYFLDDTTNAFIILTILVLSGVLSFWQERSAADAVARLLAVIETKTPVLRGGRELTVSREAIVPGDVVMLRTGSLVPGDCRLLESDELCADESALTGESFPVEKTAGPISAGDTLSKRTNSLFLGTHIVTGTGKAMVVKVGNQTEFGQISKRLEQRPPTTGFERGLRDFGKLLLAITAVLVVVVFLANVFFHRPVVESLLFALALAVGMTPQLLPAITSVVLASGAKTMAKSEVIVKRLLAIENFGGMNILCLDKTGTLTEGAVELQSARDAAGQENERVLRLAGINAYLEKGFENPIDAAIRRSLPSLPDGVRRLDELPYDFNRKRLSVLISDYDRRIMITKGAMNNILEICENVEFPNGKLVPIESASNELVEQFRRWSDEGCRVLAIAYRSIDQPQIDKSDEAGMTFVGFLIFSDPLKGSIGASMQKLADLGIQLKLITGDNHAVALSIGRQVGLRNAQALTGAELRSLSQDELRARALNTDIFAEIEPEQKERIVLALKSAGHIVGFLGDGINDAPALHAADVGISVAGAVDVAKEAADVVLLKSDLGVLAKGVFEGRKTLANTLKYVFVSISANFGYMLSMAIASLFLPFLPLLPTQILLINLLADFPAMALATDSVDPETVDRPRRWDVQTILRFMLMFGLTGTCFDLLTFSVMLNLFQTTEEEFQTGWFLVSIITGLLILLAVRTNRSFLRSRPSPWLMIAATCVAITTIILPFSPLANLFGLAKPSLALLTLVTVIAIFYAIAMEAGKKIFYHQQRFDPSQQSNHR